jgi:hypothetical protein
VLREHHLLGTHGAWLGLPAAVAHAPGHDDAWHSRRPWLTVRLRTVQGEEARMKAAGTITYFNCDQMADKLETSSGLDPN